MIDHETCILGGGLAGLAASIYSGAPVYEAEGQGGGVAQSDRTDGFTFDRGIHILQTSNQVVLDLLSELGVEFRSHNRQAFIYSHRAYTPYPFQVNTSALPLGLRTRCVWQFFNRDTKTKPANYEEWIYQSVGKAFGDTFLIPYSDKFWTVHPREMTHEWTGNRDPQPTARQVLRGAFWSRQTKIGTNSTFRYPIGEAGYGTVAQALARRAAQVYTGHRAVELDTDRRLIRFSNGSTVRYQSLISTLPLPELIRISSQAPLEVVEAASRLRTNSIMVVNLGFGRPAPPDKHWVHFPERDVSFFRISYPHSFDPGVAPAGTYSVSAEVAYSDHRPIDKATIADRVIADLRRVGAIRQDDPVILKTTRDIKYAYCIYDTHRTESLRVIHAWLRQVGITPSGRYGLWTYFWSDEAILSGKKSAESVSRKKVEVS
ncbi:MAG TPA: FAD-dependent oxidoreductase [Bryobacteraceae bacterium]|nr:FAD-dependent oxidoreductase [Bryobacteraceae bacterium]